MKFKHQVQVFAPLYVIRRTLEKNAVIQRHAAAGAQLKRENLEKLPRNEDPESKCKRIAGNGRKKNKMKVLEEEENLGESEFEIEEESKVFIRFILILDRSR